MKRLESTYLDENKQAISTQKEISQRSPGECLEWSDEDWQNAHSKLSNLPYLTPDHKLYSKISSTFYEVSEVRGLSNVNEYDSNASVEMVDPRLIVRAPSFKNWSSHYHPCRSKESEQIGEPSVIEIARKITQRKSKSMEKLDDIYQANSAGVKLKRINGPRGPIYLVSDGSHRVAAAKLVGLSQLRAMVGETKSDIETDFWFEAIREMSEEAKHELMRVYDLVYPPAKEDLANEEKLTVKAKRQEEKYLEIKNQYYIEREREAIARALKNSERKKIFDRAGRIYAKLKGDPVFEQIRREEALAHIREYMEEHEDDYFHERYTYEMTSNGWLLNKDGEPDFPVVGYDVEPNSYSVVLTRAVKAYEHYYPDKIAEIEGGL